MLPSKRIKIAVLKGCFASYSEGFYRRIFNRQDISVKVYCQDSIPGLNLETVHHKFPEYVKIVKFISLNRGKLTWQFLPWYEIIRNNDVIFVEGNPRNLSHFLFATVLRILRKNVVLWTMAHSYQSNPIRENLRLLWSRMFSFLLVYTEDEVFFLRKKGFARNFILGQNNGLDQKKIDTTIQMWPQKRINEWRKAHILDGYQVILSCARLDPKNNFQLLAIALKKIIEVKPTVKWVVIGDGVENEKLVSLVEKLKLTEHVIFVGELYNEEKLAPWFLSAEIFVHPGAIGLSLMHAFGYGLPVITHNKRELHCPEFSAFVPGKTGFCFEKDNVDDLSDKILLLLQSEALLLEMREYTQNVVRHKYNVDIMAEQFIKIAKLASSKELFSNKLTCS